MIDSFLPGKWKDLIDVNDFINLNKIPFNELSISNKVEISFESYVSFLNQYVETGEFREFPDERLLSIHFFDEKLSEFSLQDTRFPFPFSKEKRFSELFNETSSLSLKNAFRIGLLKKDIGDDIPPIFSPDIRQLPLYGIKKIIQMKKTYLKQTENGFQSPDWIEQRIDIQRQIESLEHFEKIYKFLSEGPARSAQEAMNHLLLSIMYAIKENPHNTFHISSLLDFLDIYIESDISRGVITEEDAMLLFAEFYTKLIYMHYFFKKKNRNYLVTETIFSKEPTKTTFRFLDFYRAIKKHQFPIAIVVSAKENGTLGGYFDELIVNKSPVRFINERLINRNRIYSLSHLGFPYEPDKDVVLFNKPCELTKIFYLTLNGGKDVETNRNLVPVYQKFKKDTIDFDSFMTDLTDYISLVFTIYSEANNLTMYLSEKYFSHPFRSSFKQNFQLYQYYFSFLNIDKLANLLLAIKEDEYIITRNKKGFITELRQTKKFDDDEISDMILEISYIIDEEIKKVPYFQFGKPNVFLHLNETMIDIDKYPFTLFAPEMLGCRFIIDHRDSIFSFEDIIKISNSNILDIQINK